MVETTRGSYNEKRKDVVWDLQISSYKIKMIKKIFRIFKDPCIIFRRKELFGAIRSTYDSVQFLSANFIQWKQTLRQ